MPSGSDPRLKRDPDQLARSWVAYRNTDPFLERVFWRPGSDGRPRPQPTGRWHEAGRGYAQYLSLTEDGALAAWVREADIETPDEAADSPRRIWVACVHETDIADLSTYAKIIDCGLEPSD